MNRKIIKMALGLFAVALIAVIFFVLNSGNFHELSTVDGIVDYARSFGAVMPAAAFGVTALHAMIPFVPFVFICTANGLLFGTFQGVVLTLTGSLAGASVAFMLTRFAGVHWFSHNPEGFIAEQRDKLQGLRGFWIILALRLQPYFPSVAVNALAGVSRIRFIWFLLASALGKLPLAVGYTVLGNTILNSNQWALGSGIILLIVLVPYLFGKRRKIALFIKAEGKK